MSAPKERRFPKIKGHKPKRIDLGNGIRQRADGHVTSAATIERRIQLDTCGLGYWREPEDWCKEPFSHTVTTVCGLDGQQRGWHLYNSGVVVTLAVHPMEGPFVRGAPYVWCKAAHDRNGNIGVYPTAPIFGRFIEWSGDRPKVLAGRAESAVLAAEYVYCFRANGMIGRDADLYTRSEIPVPIPTAAERQEQPEEFDVLQHHINALDQVLCNMADVVDMTDELDDAAKKRGQADDYAAKAERQARAYKVLDDLVTTALRSSAQVKEQLANFLEASPRLGRYLARWQADDAKT